MYRLLTKNLEREWVTNAWNVTSAQALTVLDNNFYKYKLIF